MHKAQAAAEQQQVAAVEVGGIWHVASVEVVDEPMKEIQVEEDWCIQRGERRRKAKEMRRRKEEEKEQRMIAAVEVAEGDVMEQEVGRVVEFVSEAIDQSAITRVAGGEGSRLEARFAKYLFYMISEMFLD